MAINRSVDHNGSRQSPALTGSRSVSVAEAQLARVANDGCARHPHLTALLDATSPHASRDLADGVHLLCHLHGRYPGLIEIALRRCVDGETQPWLTRAGEEFERERLFLVRLTSAVGPLPSTPGAAETEGSLHAARHALETLGLSDRNGC